MPLRLAKLLFGRERIMNFLCQFPAHVLNWYTLIASNLRHWGTLPFMDIVSYMDLFWSGLSICPSVVWQHAHARRRVLRHAASQIKMRIILICWSFTTGCPPPRKKLLYRNQHFGCCWTCFLMPLRVERRYNFTCLYCCSFCVINLIN